MDDQRLGVADVGEQREDLDVIDEPAAGIDATANTERDDPAEATVQVALGELMARMRGQAGVGNPGDLGLLLEPLRDRERILAMALDSQREGFEALQEEEGVERAERRSDVAEALDAQLQD